MAAISAVKICNMALAHIGARSSIESLDETSTEAKACKLWYDWARLQVLEGFNWNFARKRKVLAVLEEEPYDDWAVRYEYPSDCVKARLIFNPAGPDADPVPFEVTTTDDGQTSCILTDMEDAQLIYTFDMTNTARFSPKFVDALAWRLAACVAFTLTGKREIEQSALQYYHQFALPMAINSNAGDGRDRTPRDSDWIRAQTD